MTKIFSFLTIVALFLGGIYLFQNFQRAQNYGAPPYSDDIEQENFSIEEDFSDWKRPDGPLKVGIQAGHWKTSEMPEEQRRLRERGGGTRNGEVTEWEVNLRIAEETKKILEKEGITVEILPSTIPPSYWADAFVSIHADGNPDPSKSGFKVAAPRRDYSGRSKELANIIDITYGNEIDMVRDPNITRNMTGYYAFAWWRFEHAIHPMTPAAILETGFLSSPQDFNLLVYSPEKSAQAIAKALLAFLKT